MDLDDFPRLKFPPKTKDDFELFMQIRETNAKKLIARRECTQFTYIYTPSGQKVRRSALIIE